MRSRRVSLLIVAAALIAAFAVPQCRGPAVWTLYVTLGLRPAGQEARGAAQGEGPQEVGLAHYLPFFPDAGAIAAEHPGDWEDQLAAAETRLIRLPSPSDSAYQYFRQASRLKPESPVAHFRLALALLHCVPFAGEKVSDVPSLSEEERKAALDQAEKALMEARGLDRESAATDYLLAYVALARGNEPAARRWLESAWEKPRCTFYDREVKVARLHVCEQAELDAFRALWYFAVWPSGLRVARPVKALAGQAAARGDEFRKQGKHGEAIAWYWAGFRLGYLVMSQGHDTSEAMSGKASAARATASFLSDQERQAISAKFRGAEQERDPEQSRGLRQALDKARVQSFQAYLREQGREDLAEEHAEALAKMERVHERIRSTMRSRGPIMELMEWLMPLMVSLEVLMASQVVIVMWGVAAILWPILRRRAGGRQPTAWSWGTWGMMFLISSAPAVAVLLLLPAVSWETMDVWIWAPAAALTGGILVFLLLTLGVMIVRRRRAGGEATGGFRDFMHAVWVLLLPTVAVLVVVWVGTLPAADRAIQRFSREQVQKIEQGEMVYYGLLE